MRLFNTVFLIIKLKYNQFFGGVNSFQKVSHKLYCLLGGFESLYDIYSWLKVSILMQKIRNRIIINAGNIC